MTANVETKGSALPWKACPSIEGDFLGIYPDTDRSEFPIAIMPTYVRAEINDTHADLIVRAVNCHDDLVAALRTCRCPGGGWNGMPEDMDPTVENCMAAGACGCDCGAALAKALPEDKGSI